MTSSKAIFLCAVLLVSPAGAQTIYNVPPDSPPSHVGANSIVNIYDGGYITSLLIAEDGAVVNFSGGTIGNALQAKTGAIINMSGGSVTSDLHVFAGAHLVLSGGTMAEIAIWDGADATFLGYDFRVDGVLVPDLQAVGQSVQVQVAFGAVLSGTFQDGTPFVFSWAGGIEQLAEAVTLKAVMPPPLPPSVTISSSTNLLGIGDSQTLILKEGGVLPRNFNAGRGSEVQIDGGIVTEGFEAFGSHVLITGGFVETFFDAYQGSIIDVNGGFMEGEVRALKGSVVNVRGGTINNGLFNRIREARFNLYSGSAGRIDAQDGDIYVENGRFFDVLIDDSRVTIAGGSIGEIEASHSEIVLRGGVFDDALRIDEQSHVTIVGYGFLLEGQPIDSLNAPGDTVVVTERGGKVLTGVFANGDSFSFDLLPFRRGNTGFDSFSTDTTVRLILIPEPLSAGFAIIGSMGSVAFASHLNQARRRHASLDGRSA